MLTFQVFGISHEATEKQLFDLRYQLTKVAGSAPWMKIDEDSIFPFFTPNQMERVNNPDEIVVLVHGLCPDPEITDKMVGQFCKVIGETIKSFLEKEELQDLSDDSKDHFIGVIPYFVRSKECCFSTNTQ